MATAPPNQPEVLEQMFAEIHKWRLATLGRVGRNEVEDVQQVARLEVFKAWQRTPIKQPLAFAGVVLRRTTGHYLRDHIVPHQHRALYDAAGLPEWQHCEKWLDRQRQRRAVLHALSVWEPISKQQQVGKHFLKRILTGEELEPGEATRYRNEIHRTVLAMRAMLAKMNRRYYGRKSSTTVVLSMDKNTVGSVAEKAAPYQVRIDPHVRKTWAEWCKRHGLLQRVAVANALQAFMRTTDKTSK